MQQRSVVIALALISEACVASSAPPGYEGTYIESPTNGGIVFSGDVVTLKSGHYEHSGFTDNLPCREPAIAPCQPYSDVYSIEGNRTSFVNSRLVPPERFIVEDHGDYYLLKESEYRACRFFRRLPPFSLRRIPPDSAPE